MRKRLLVLLKILPRGTDQALGIQKYAMLPALQKRQCPAVASLRNQVSYEQSSVGMFCLAPKHAVTAVDAAGVQNLHHEPMNLRSGLLCSQSQILLFCKRTSSIDKPCIRCSAMAIISPMPVPASPAP